jgi:hypothetical protein
VGIVLSVAILTAALAMAGELPQESMTEYSVKAAFLFNFARFVEWPPESRGTEKDPFCLCIFGHDPFHGDLDRVIRNKRVNGRVLTVRRISTPAEARTCHMVFISAADKSRVRELLAAVRDSGSLTVGEDPEFTRSGGMITFVIEDDKVRFEINLKSAEAAHLKISAKVLSVARAVRVGSAKE